MPLKALGLAVAALVSPAAARPTASTPGPTVKLIAASRVVTASTFNGHLFLDPGVYVTSLVSALQFDVRRASYSKPETITQVIFSKNGSTTTRPLPASVLDGYYGLRDFLRLTVTNRTGAVATSRMTFCPTPTIRSAHPQEPRARPRTRRNAPSIHFPEAW